MTSPTAAAVADDSRTIARRLAARSRPALRQTWINFKAWAPFFRNRAERERLAAYPFQDYRAGLVWRIVAPRQCWHCGKSNGLKPLAATRSVRAFEHALAIAAAAAAGWAVALSIGWFVPAWGARLGLFVTAAGVGVLLLKSWKEAVELTVWTCSDHVGRPPAIELASDDGKLWVQLPTHAMAELAANEIAAVRKLGRRGGPSRETSSREISSRAGDAQNADAAAGNPYVAPSRSPPADLPPIKLAGDEDE